MRKFLASGILAASVVGASPANAVELINIINSPVVQKVISTNFVATDSTTTLIFGGYQLPSFEQVQDISVTPAAGGANLAPSPSTWTFTAAPSGSEAHVFYYPAGVDIGFEFGGLTPKSYDLFSTDLATTAGQTYDLSFLYTQDYAGPNGLKVTVGETVAEVAAQSALPEASSWVMMLAGIGTVGFALRRQRRMVPSGHA